MRAPEDMFDEDDDSFERELFARRAHALPAPELSVDAVFTLAAKRRSVSARLGGIAHVARHARAAIARSLQGPRFAATAGACLGVMLVFAGALKSTSPGLHVESGALFSTDDQSEALAGRLFSDSELSPLVPACVLSESSPIAHADLGQGAVCEDPAPRSESVGGVSCGRNVTCAPVGP